MIDFVIDKLNNDNIDYTFSGFLEMLAENVEANPEALEQYVLQLLDYGLIEWDWPFSGLNPKWHILLEDLLNQFSEDKLLKELKDTLSFVQEGMQQFEDGNLIERAAAQQKAFDQLKKHI